MMIKKYILIFALINIGLFVCGQKAETNKVKVTEVIRKIEDVRVNINQYKSLCESPDIPFCSAEILISKNNSLIDSIKYSVIDPVGGYYGLLVYPESIKDHIVISKYGDYDGETIIINNKAEKFITVGGYSFIDKSSGLLFSILDSDLSGFSVFDLNTDKEIFKIVDIEERPQNFYKAYNNRYFFQAINDESEDKSIWEIEFDMDRIMQVDLDIKKIEEGKLMKLADYDKIDINCE